jgi:hypothetical protein
MAHETTAKVSEDIRRREGLGEYVGSVEPTVNLLKLSKPTGRKYIRTALGSCRINMRIWKRMLQPLDLSTGTSLSIGFLIQVLSVISIMIHPNLFLLRNVMFRPSLQKRGSLHKRLELATARLLLELATARLPKRQTANL